MQIAFFGGACVPIFIGWLQFPCTLSDYRNRQKSDSFFISLKLPSNRFCELQLCGLNRVFEAC